MTLSQILHAAFDALDTASSLLDDAEQSGDAISSGELEQLKAREAELDQKAAVIEARLKAKIAASRAAGA